MRWSLPVDWRASVRWRPTLDWRPDPWVALGVAQSFVLAAFFVRGIFARGYLLHNDFVTPLRYTGRFFDRFLYAWDPVAGGFSYNAPKLVLQAPLALLASLGVSTALLYKLVVVFILGLAGATMFHLVYRLAGARTSPARAYAAGTLAALLFTTNPWTLNKIHHHFWLVLGIGLLPVIYQLYLRALDGRGGLPTLLALSALFAVEATQPHSLFIYVGPMLAIAGVVWLLESPSIARAREGLVVTAKLLAVAVLLNAFWVVPLALFYAYTSPTPGGYLLTAENLHSLSRHSSMLRASHLRSGIGMKSLLDPGYAASYRTGVELLDRLWPVVGTAITAFSLSSLLSDRRSSSRHTLVFGILTVLSLLLLTGTRQPLGDLYLRAALELPMGWMLRDPFKFGGLFVFALSALFGLATARLLALLELTEGRARFGRLRLWPFELLVGPARRRAGAVPYAGVLSVAVVLAVLGPATLLHGWPMLTGDVNDHFEPSEVPDEYEAAFDWLADNATDGRVLWLPDDGFSVADPNIFWYTWPEGIARHHVRGNQFLEFSTPAPTMPHSPGNKRLTMWLHEKLRSDTIERPSVPLQAAGVGYVAFHTDVVDRTHADDILGRLRLDPAITPVFSRGNVTVFRVAEGSTVRATRLLQLGDLDDLDTLYQSGAPNATTPPVATTVETDLAARDGLVSSGEPTPWYRELGTTVTPFDATAHHRPGLRWSKGDLHDPWQGRFHRYLVRRGSNTWQTDFGDGVAFTWAPERVAGRPDLTAEQRLVRWPFVGPRAAPGWHSLDDEQRTNVTQGHLKLTLEESNYGWKRVESPEVDVEADRLYRFSFDVLARDGHGVHAKVAEYDRSGELVHLERVAHLGSGDLHRDGVTVDYVPRNSSTDSLRLQLWHGHETRQPLPNEVRLDNVEVYDVSRFAEPVSLETTVTLNRSSTYRIVGRVFQNRDGGKLRVSIDGEPIPVDTDASIDRFVWDSVATLNLSAGTHTVRIDNVYGFNAVNALQFVPVDRLRRRKAAVDDALQNDAVVYHLDAASDLRTRDAVEITRRRAGRNRPLETIRTGGRAWRTIEVAKSGSYTLAVRGSGTFRVRVGERTVRFHSDDPATRQYGPFSLPRGSHTVAVEPVPRTIRTVGFERSGGWSDGTSNYTAERAPVAASGEHSLAVSATEPTEGWSWVTTDPLAVDPGRAYEFGASLKLRNADQSHVAVQGYDRSLGEWRRLGTVTEGRSGTTDWRAYSSVIDVPSDVRRVRFVLNAGWAADPGGPTPSTWIDDLAIRGVEHNVIDAVDLVSAPGNESLSSVVQTAGDVASVESVRRLDPTTYRVRVNASNPYALSLAEGYDPLWVATVRTDDGLRRVEPTRIAGSITGFRIDETGEYTVRIHYRPQGWLELGSLLSALTLLSCLGVVAGRRRGWTLQPGRERLASSAGRFRRRLHSLRDRLRAALERSYRRWRR